VLVLSPRECTIVSFDVPPLSADDIDALVAAKLRSHYPGNGAAAVDWRSNGKGRVLAVASLRERVARSLSREDATRIFVTADLARAAAADRSYLALTLVDGRAEAWAVARGTVSRAETITTPTASSVENAVTACREALATESDVPVYLVSDHSDTSMHARLADAADESPSFETTVERALRRYKPLFGPKRPRGRGVTIATVALALAAFAAGIYGVYDRFAELRAAEQVAQAELLAAQRAYTRAIDLQDQIDEFELRTEGVREEGPHPYAYLSALGLVLPDADRVEQLSLTDGRFELQATGPSGLTSLELLRAAPGVTSASLRQLVAEGSDRERFVITGSFE
jgi:type II secretory pathway pseudopilin PulG